MKSDVCENCSIFRISTDEYNPIGQVFVRCDETDGYFVYGFYVWPEYRGKGYSRKLANLVIDKYPTQRLWADVGGFAESPMTDEQLIEYYKEFGFEPYPTDDGLNWVVRWESTDE